MRTQAPPLLRSHETFPQSGESVRRTMSPGVWGQEMVQTRQLLTQPSKRRLGQELSPQAPGSHMHPTQRLAANLRVTALGDAYSYARVEVQLQRVRVRRS